MKAKGLEKRLREIMKRVTEKPKREVVDTSKFEKKDVPLCSVCETSERLYSKAVTMLFYRHVPHLTLLSQIVKDRICRECIERFVRVRLRIKNKVFSSTKLIKELKDQGHADVTLEKLIVLGAKLGFAVYLSLRRPAWKKEMRSRQYKATRRLAISDYIDHLYEQPLRPKRRKREKKEVTVDNILDALMKAKSEPIKARPMKKRRTVSVEYLTAKVTGEKVEPEYGLTAKEYGKTPTLRRLEAQPCRTCTKVICDTECAERVLYQRVQRYHRGGTR